LKFKQDKELSMSLRKDLHTHVKSDSVLNPTTISGGAGDVTQDNLVDRQGFDSLVLLAHVGESGDTLSGSVKLDFIITEGDEADGSDQAIVDDEHVIHGVENYDTATGIFATVDDAAEDDAVYQVGYAGYKRYVGLTVTKTGTHTNGTPVGVLAVKGTPARTMA